MGPSWTQDLGRFVGLNADREADGAPTAQGGEDEFSPGPASHPWVQGCGSWQVTRSERAQATCEEWTHEG